tara:strand:- start:1515 stop:1970 length:456 start_codon:yes stop_codon:yes gene_type:complete
MPRRNITNEQVIKILRLVYDNVTPKKIAYILNISYNTVFQVLSGRGYKDITNLPVGKLHVIVHMIKNNKSILIDAKKRVENHIVPSGKKTKVENISLKELPLDKLTHMMNNTNTLLLEITTEIDSRIKHANTKIEEYNELKDKMNSLVSSI